MYNENLRLIKPCKTCGKTMFCENPKYKICAECASKLPPSDLDKFVDNFFGNLPSDK